jgi:hypothetical protein
VRGLLKPCGNGSCPRLVPAGTRFCREHELADSARRNERVRRYGYGRAHWQGLRKVRIAHAKGRCELRLPGCTGRATHCHLDAALAGNHDAATKDWGSRAGTAVAGARPRVRSGSGHAPLGHFEQPRTSTSSGVTVIR